MIKFIRIYALYALYALHALAYLSNNGRFNMLTGSEYISNYLQKNYPNSNTIFTYPGGANLKLLDTLSKNNHFKLIFNRHEQFVGHSAEGYAKSSDKIGIAITTSGPGITNMITPLQDALSDSIPMICISAQVSSKVLGTNAFQEVDAIGLTKSCTKWNYLVDKIEKLPNALDLAFYHALLNKKGPVHLDICSDVLSDDITEKDNIIKIDNILTGITKRETKIGNNKNYLAVKINDNLPDKSLLTINKEINRVPFNIKLSTFFPNFKTNLYKRNKFNACEIELNLQAKPFINDIDFKSRCIDNRLTLQMQVNKQKDMLDTYTTINKLGIYNKTKDYNFNINDNLQGKIVQDYITLKSINDNSGKIQKYNATEFELNLNLEPLNILKPIFINQDSPDKINLKGSFVHNKIGVKTLDNVTNNPIYNCKSNIPLKKYYQVQKIALLLNNAKSPVIIVGKGAIDSYKEIRKLSKTFSIPVATTLHGLGIIDEDEDLSLKMLGMHGTAYANIAIQQADVIIGIGYRFDDRTIGNPFKYAPKARKNNGIIHIDINSNNIDIVKKTVSPDISLELDCKTFIEEINPLLYEIKLNRKMWKDKIVKLKEKYQLTYKLTDNLKIPDVIKELSNQVKDNSNFIITTGVGNHQMMTAQYFTWKYPKQMISSGSLGTMGVGLPFAIGSKFANQDKTVICIDGDGSFMMSIQELATIREYNIPIKILIMNDNSLQMVTTWQEMFYDNNIVGTKPNNPKFKEVARSFGIKSIYCNSKYNLNAIIRYILAYNGPILCEFNIEPDICTPFVKPGNALDDMIL